MTSISALELCGVDLGHTVLSGEDDEETRDLWHAERCSGKGLNHQPAIWSVAAPARRSRTGSSRHESLRVTSTGRGEPRVVTASTMLAVDGLGDHSPDDPFGHLALIIEVSSRVSINITPYRNFI